MLERNYQPKVIKKLRELLPGCVILKNDPNYLQGFPDLLILHGNRWAALETKRSSSASHRPNQDYYINKLKGMSYAAFIFPENERTVLDEVQCALSPARTACISKRK